MTRLVHPLRSKPRCTPDLRLRRVWTRRNARCAGAHRDCPACERIQLPVAFPRARAREARRLRFGSDTPV